MMFSIGFFVGLPGRGQGVSSPAPSPAARVRIAEPPRDRFVYDSGAAQGLAAATVPLSGTALQGDGTTPLPDGTEIEVRAVSLEDAGAQTTPWTDAGVTAGGAWATALSVPRAPSWFRAEARVKGAGETAAAQDGRFGSGHVWAIWEQSNWAKLMDTGASLPPAPAIARPGDVTLFERNATAPIIIEGIDRGAEPAIAGAIATRTSAQVAFINALSAERPGEKFAVAWHTQSGTSFDDALTTEAEDPDGSRDWAFEAALHEALTGAGATPVGLVTANGWIAANGADAGTANGFVARFTGRDIQTGAPLTPADLGLPRLFFGVNEAGTEGGGLYDLRYTKVGWVGNHGRDNNGLDKPEAAPVTVANGGTVADLPGYGNPADDDYDAMMALFKTHLGQAHLPETLPWQMFTLGGRRGDYNVEDDTWSDVLHYSTRQRDGRTWLAEIGALAMLKTAGLASWDAPDLDSRFDLPDGSASDWWIAGRSLTTMREHLQARGELATWSLGGAPQPSYPMPATYPHWTQVMGWEVDGLPAERAELYTVTAADVAAGHPAPAGTVVCRVYPNGGGAFNFGSSIVYGPGRFPGRQIRHADLSEAIHLNYLHVDMGQAGRPLLPVAPRSSDTIATTLPAPAAFTTGPGTHFADGATGPKILDETAATVARFEIVGRLDVIDGSQCLAACTNEMRVAVFGSGRIEMEMTNYGPNPRSAAGVVNAGTTYRIVAVQDRDNDLAYIDIGPPDGPLTRVAEERGTIGFAPGDTFRGRQQVMFLRTPSGPSDQVKGGTFSSLKVWLDDAEGAGPPDKVIAGDAASVNADPWRVGDPAT